MKCQVKFLSTLSLRRATLRPTGNQPITPNFYPRSPCGERHPKTSNHPHSTNFYPRSPCGERPSYSQHVTRPSGYFYPRSPCGERRAARFTPTASRNFYPRSPCGERPEKLLQWLNSFSISIHALLAESDHTSIYATCNDSQFLSTLSLRRATAEYPRYFHLWAISIHALLAESDKLISMLNRPHSQFLSTLSLRRATHYDNYNLHCVEISIHALLAESDLTHDTRKIIQNYFYPRSPCGERPSRCGWF